MCNKTKTKSGKKKNTTNFGKKGHTVDRLMKYSHKWNMDGEENTKFKMEEIRKLIQIVTGHANLERGRYLIS